MEKIDVFLVEQTKNIWKENRLELDVYVIDLQHLWLLFLINKLEKIVQDQKNNAQIIPSEIEKIITDFVHYTEYHFNAEELLIKSLNYTEIEKHIAEHKSFKEKIAYYNNPNFFSKHENIIQIKNYLNQWLMNHINIEDRKLISFYKTQIDINDFFQKKILEGEIELHKEVQHFYKILFRFQDDVFDLSKEYIRHVRIIWERYKLKTGIPIIDLQHLWLIYIIVKLEDSLKIEDQTKRLSIYKSILDELINYVNEHFQTEEIMMNVSDYKSSNEHREVHQSFVNEVVKIKKEFEMNANRTAEIIASKLLLMLKNWLFAHIIIHDKDFAKYASTNNQKLIEYSKRYTKEQGLHINSKQVLLYKAIVTNT